MNLSKIVQTCLNLSKLVLTSPNLSKLVQTGPNLFKLVQTCSNLSKIGQTWLNLVKLYQIWPDLFKLDQNWSTCSDLLKLVQFELVFFGKTKQQQIIILYTYCMHISTRVWRKKQTTKTEQQKTKCHEICDHIVDQKKKKKILFFLFTIL